MLTLLSGCSKIGIEPGADSDINNDTPIQTAETCTMESNDIMVESDEMSEIIFVANSNDGERSDLQEIIKIFEDQYDKQTILLKYGEESKLTPVGVSDFTPNGVFRYGVWTMIKLCSTEVPISTVSNDTFRISSGGYSYDFTESGTHIVYKYFLYERCKYYGTAAVKIIVDDDGNRIWLDEDGNTVMNDVDYTEWEDTETISCETPMEIYEKELERLVPLEYEINYDGETPITYHYVFQIRQHI